LGELGNLFVRMDDLKQVVYSVVKVEGLRRKDSMRTMLRAGYASSFPFASPNMPSWNSALYFPAFVVLEATNVRYLARDSFFSSLSSSLTAVVFVLFSSV
jgi:uncharacterized protein YbbC (DUF1343 family)